MQAKPELRKSERFDHGAILNLGDDRTLSPYYAVSQNLSETGIYFKSLFELHPGAHIRIRMDDYTLENDYIAGRVVWCKELKDSSTFRYGVGVEILHAPGDSAFKAVRPTARRKKNPHTEEGGVVIHMRQGS